MNAPSLQASLPAPSAIALAGTWKLARGQAVTLRPASAGIVRIVHGRVWATVDGPHGGTPSDSGDHVLGVGRSMWVQPGQRVVLEPWSRGGSAYFRWEPAPAPAAVPAAAHRRNMAEVLQPLAELRAALRLGGDAFVRLLVGLGRLALPAAHNGRHGNACTVR
ncbi:MAG TPA: DUF2917 domain-containing protein [Ramlibacter sp.]|nr:DUF2917 domain-containing protein [Ramlibacter sp.]